MPVLALKKQIRVKVYYNESAFSEVAKSAEDAGFRRKGLNLFNQSAHGFKDERVANTDGIAKYLKACQKYYIEHEAERLLELAKLKQTEKETAERIHKLGGNK